MHWGDSPKVAKREEGYVILTVKGMGSKYPIILQTSFKYEPFEVSNIRVFRVIISKWAIVTKYLDQGI